MKHDKTILGIICVMIGMGTGSLMDTMIKLLSGDYPLHQIVMARSVVAIILTLFIVRLEGGLHLLKTSKPLLHLLRGILIVIANMSYYVALSSMPLAEVAAIFFVSPLFITALSVPILGEHVGWRRWVAVIFGFAGVVIMMRPGLSSFSYTSLLPVLAALAYAITQITTRRLGATDVASVMSFYIGLTFIFIAGGFWIAVGDGSYAGDYGVEMDFLLRAWHWPNTKDAAIMVGIGLLVTVVGYMLSQAYRVADASVVSPFEYVALPLAIMWGYIFWRDVPDAQSMLGIVLIVGSGLYVFIREKQSTPAQKLHDRP